MVLAQAAGLPVIIDLDYRPYSWASAEDASATYRHAASLCDIVIGNDVEFAVMAAGGDGMGLARDIAADGTRIAIYKMGEKGSVTFSGGHAFETGIYPVKALKPTGAGDAFMGGFLTSLASGLDLETAVKRGSAAAAITVTRAGCAPALPTASELHDFIASA
jgi:5-dehydro-2-deoxygluconokinase